MYFWIFALVLLLPALAVSITMALLPVRHPRLLTAWAAAHVVVSALLIWRLPPDQYWRIVLFPGMVLAAIRLIRVLATGRTKL